MAIQKYVCALLFAFVLTAPAWAQEESADRVDRRLEMMDEKLDLTEEQKAEIGQIWTNHRAEMKAWIDANENATREQRRDHFRSRADEVHTAVVAVLTPEQAAQFASIREAGRERLKEGRRGAHMRGERQGRRGERGMRREGAAREMRGGPGMLVERIANELELSDAQRDEVQDIVERHHEDGTSWRNANPDADREQISAFHEGHFAELKAELEQVLTPDQVSRFEELHERMRDRMEHRGSKSGRPGRR